MKFSRFELARRSFEFTLLFVSAAVWTAWHGSGIKREEYFTRRAHPDKNCYSGHNLKKHDISLYCGAANSQIQNISKNYPITVLPPLHLLINTFIWNRHWLETNVCSLEVLFKWQNQKVSFILSVWTMHSTKISIHSKSIFHSEAY